MQTYPVVFTGAAQRVGVNVPGRYLVLLRLDTNPVNIELFWHGRKLNLGTLTNWTTGPLAGLEIGPLPALDDSGAAFDRVVLESTGADTCVLGIGDGSVRYNRSQGSVALTSPLVLDNADGQAEGNSLLGTVARVQGYAAGAYYRIGATNGNNDGLSVNPYGLQTSSQLRGFNGSAWDRIRADSIGGAGSARVTDRGFAYATSHESTTALALTNGTEQIFAAAANTNGCMVWDGGIACHANGAGSAVVSLHANTVAPTSFLDGDALMLASSFAATNAGQIAGTDRINRPIFVPSGRGLWWLNTGTTTEQLPRRRLLYTLL
jgi:hypothetical protein